MGAPYMPLYAVEFLQDERCMSVSASTAGAWIRTICLMWSKETAAITMDREGWEYAWNVRPPEDMDHILRQMGKVATVTVDEDEITIYSKRVDQELDTLRDKRDQGKRRQQGWHRRKIEQETEESNALETRQERVNDAFRYNSLSHSLSKVELKEGSGGKEEITGEQVETIYPAYPRKIGKRFEPPTLEETQAHFVKKGAPEKEAENFYHYYESVGWTVGRSNKKMKSWPSAATRWINNMDQFSNTRTGKTNADRSSTKRPAEMSHREWLKRQGCSDEKIERLTGNAANGQSTLALRSHGDG